ncbi:MAG: hypothetical protein Athens101426_40 [Parcubacteria group bacterium Athens1014_26]|nr:MAG: hypothetical protein Athens101426_40 [Parcubacteria group bacterium Athens1014_26]
MKKMIAILSLFIVIVVVAGLYGIFVYRGGGDKTTRVKINNSVFEVEVAKSLAELSKGLSGREGLAESKGMLFVFSFSGKNGFWMKDMKFPLDIIWIKDNRIVGIEKNVPPPATAAEGLKIYYPPESINKVLEINAGLSDKLGIKVGDEAVY